MKTYLIYAIRNVDEGKYYIGRTGSTLERRRSWHYSNARKTADNGYLYNNLISKALRENPENAFEWLTLESGLSRELGYEREAYYIAKFNAFGEGYNEKEGDRVPWNKGKRMSQKYCDNLKGKGNGMYGKTHSDDYKAWRRRYMSECQRSSNNVMARRVRCLENGQIWESVVECAKDTGINKDNISSCCNPNRKNRSAGGLHFEYIDTKELTHNTSIYGTKNPRARAVRRKEDSKTWETIRECSQEMGVSESAISRSCRTTGASKGFHFEYA